VKHDPSDRPHYSDTDFAAIAAAVGVDVCKVTQNRTEFFHASFWYASTDTGLIPSVAVMNKLEQISKTARNFVTQGGSLAGAEPDGREKRIHGKSVAGSDVASDRRKFDRTGAKLIRLLGVTEETAEDGLPDRKLEDALVNAGDKDEYAISQLAEAITCYRKDFPAALEAAEELARSAALGKSGAEQVRELTVTPGFHGREDLNGWIDDMLGLYSKITGHKVATSVRKPIGPDAGKAHGPLVRFLSAAGKPLGLQFSDDAWRSRVKTAEKAHCQKKN
jgi:hypothetical protein